MDERIYSIDEAFEKAMRESSEATDWTCEAFSDCWDLREVPCETGVESVVVASWGYDNLFGSTYQVLDLLKVPGHDGRLIFHNLIHDLGAAEVHGWLPDEVDRSYERRLRALQAVFARNGDSPDSWLVTHLPSFVHPSSDAVTPDDLRELFFLACTDDGHQAALFDRHPKPVGETYRDDPAMYRLFVDEVWPELTGEEAPSPGDGAIATAGESIGH